MTDVEKLAEFLDGCEYWLADEGVLQGSAREPRFNEAAAMLRSLAAEKAHYHDCLVKQSAYIHEIETEKAKATLDADEPLGEAVRYVDEIASLRAKLERAMAALEKVATADEIGMKGVKPIARATLEEIKE